MCVFHSCAHALRKMKMYMYICTWFGEVGDDADFRFDGGDAGIVVAEGRHCGGRLEREEAVCMYM